MLAQSTTCAIEGDRMTDVAVNAWDEMLIAEMREHDGRPTSGPLEGHPLLLLHVVGARSGEPRRSILTYSRDGEDYIVAGTAGGSPKAPAWLANLRANPEVTIEIGARTFAATATIAEEEQERARLWDHHVAQLPWFADYPAQSGRAIPMVRLTEKAG
jgi:deazaflavin-dependent oxidoreductase (nitroreductase family)